MAKKIHAQKPDPRDMTCPNCKLGFCEGCVDVLRSVYTDEMICTCRRAGHLGEPTSEQILDPETGTVYAPGMTIDELGRVATDPEKVKAFLEQFKEAQGE